jgi:hypothetical protein
MQGTGACVGSCDDLTVTEEQIAIGKRDHDPRKYSAKPSARCRSSCRGRHMRAAAENVMNDHGKSGLAGAPMT